MRKKITSTLSILVSILVLLFLIELIYINATPGYYQLAYCSKNVGYYTDAEIQKQKLELDSRRQEAKEARARGESSDYVIDTCPVVGISQQYLWLNSFNFNK